MTKSQNRLLLIPYIFSASKENFIFKRTALIFMQKDYTLFTSANSALYGIFSVTGGLLLTEVVTHWKTERNYNACQNWKRYLHMQCCHIEVKLPPRPDLALVMGSAFF